MQAVPDITDVQLPVAARGDGRPPGLLIRPPLWGGENSQNYEIFFPLEINDVWAILYTVYRILIIYMIFINLRSLYKY